MGWKFWHKQPEQSADTAPQVQKLPKPKEIPYELGRHLVVDGGYDPDWVWNLKSLLLPHPDSKIRFDFRLFSPSQAMDRNISVRDYRSLDAHTDLILFDGWYDKGSREFQMETRFKKAG